MEVKLILKGLSDAFYNGCALPDGSGVGWNELDNAGKWEKAKKIAHDASYAGCTMKIGNGSFRDTVDLNGMLNRGAKPVTCRMEPRKGYRLVTFEFA